MIDKPPVLLPNLPAGWSRRNVPPPAVKRAHDVMRMGLSYGQGMVETIEGITYAFRVEPHYDDHVGGFLHWHPGISVWTKTDPAAESPPGLVPEAIPMKAQAQASPLGSILFVAIGAAAGYVLSEGRRA